MCGSGATASCLLKRNCAVIDQYHVHIRVLCSLCKSIVCVHVCARALDASDFLW